MPNWSAELETWIGTHARFANAIEAVTTEYGVGDKNKQRDELLAVVREFYGGYVLDNAGFEDTAWAGKEEQEKKFASEVVRAAVSRSWLTRLRTDSASPVFGAGAHGRLIGELRTRFKDAVAPAVAALLRKCPAPEPRYRGHRMAEFAAMGANIVATWNAGQSVPGVITRNGRVGHPEEHAERRWLTGHGARLTAALTANLAQAGLRIEIHVKAHPCGNCGPVLNQWLAAQAPLAAIPMYAYTYTDDQNGGTTNVYRMDPAGPDGSRYLNKWVYR